MSCAIDRSSFLVLGDHVGWPATESDGVNLGASVTLLPAAPAPHAIDDASLDSLLPSCWLAADGSGRWLVVGADGVLRGVRWCDPPGAVRTEVLGQARAVAGGRQGVAVIDADGTRVNVFSPGLRRWRLTAELPKALGAADLVGWASDSTLLIVFRSADAAVFLSVRDGSIRAAVTDERLDLVERVGPLRPGSGDPTPDRSAGGDGEGARCAAGTSAHVAVPVEPGWWLLFKMTERAIDCLPVKPVDVSTCLPLVARSTTDAFALPTPTGPRWLHRTTLLPTLPPPPQHVVATSGRVRLAPLDVGRHSATSFRLRLEATMPLGSGVEVSAVTHRDIDDVPARPRWFTVPAGVTDAVLRQPPGRFLTIELRLFGNGTDNVEIRTLRVDADPPNTIDQLPSVYRADPRAADFLRRFLAIADAELVAIDDQRTEAASTLDPSIPEREHLVRLCELLGLDPGQDWPVDRLVALLGRSDSIGALGTPTSIAAAIEAVLGEGVRVYIEEVAAHARQWYVLNRRGSAPLGGGARVASRTSHAVTLGASRFGAPLSDGISTDAELHNTGAFVVNLHVGGGAGLEQRYAEEVARQFLPAHLDAVVRLGRPHAAIGGWAMVGVDTVVSPPPRAGVVACDPGRPHGGGGLGGVVLGAQGGGAGVTVGRRARVGVSTTVE